MANFLAALAQRGAPSALVGEVLTDEQVMDIWREATGGYEPVPDFATLEIAVRRR